MLCLVVFFFFFQAEDGIRDRSPSRGLGDVYKRQVSWSCWRGASSYAGWVSMCSDPSVAEKIYKIGVVSDTHGYFSPDLGRAFAGVKCILHAGDVGGEHVLKELSAVAPVIAVRGNMDNGPWAQDLPWQVETEICGARVQEERLSNCGHLRRVSMAADHHRGDPILPPVAAIHLLLDVSHQNPGTTDLSLYLPREVLCPWPVIHVPPHGNHRGDSTQLLQHVFAAHVTRMQDALDPRERTSQIRGKIAMRVRYHPDFVDLLRNTGITTHTHPSGIATCARPAA